MPTKISGIDGAQIASVGASRSVQRSQDAVAGGAQSPSGAPSDESQSVQITGTARNLASLEQTLRDLPAVNETRVAHIRTAIEQGTYTVRPQNIADQLLSLEHALSHLPDPAESDTPAESGHSSQ